jgi:tetratricopeptide (TPR) repeat protein
MENPFVIDLAETVLGLGRSGATGALRIAVEHHLRLAFFEGGELVYFVPDVPEEDLGPALAREGRLATAEARAALALLERQVSRKRPLVTLALESGLCGPDRLRSWLVEHTFECFGRALDAREGTARFAAGVRAEHALPFRVPATMLLLEGVRRMRNEAVIRAAVGPLDYAANPAPDHAERVQALPLSFYDGLVASQITQPYVLADLVDVLGLPEIDVLRALLALRCVGVLAPFVPQRILRDSGLLEADSGRLRLDAGRLRADSGALEASSSAEDDGAHDGHAVALALDIISPPEELPSGSPVTIGELEGSAPTPAPAVARKAPVTPAPRKRRGNTAQLNLLASAYRQMAEAEVAAGNIGTAVRYYEAARAQCPENVDLVIGLAGLLAGRPGGEELAENLLRKACAEHPEAAGPRVAFAKLLKASGRHVQASEMLAEAQRIDPEDLEVKAMLETRQGGLFSRLKAAAHDLAASKPSSRGPGEGGSAASAKRCRYCGALCRAGAAACVRCGATL